MSGVVRELLRIGVGKAAEACQGPAGLESVEPYFTDGIDLYRFMGWVRRSEGSSLAAVEDCRSLTILLVSADYLTRPAVRPITGPNPQ